MKKSEQQDLFEKKPVAQAIVRLALPTAIGQIILVIYNLADTFFVGLTSRDSMITAVTVCMPAFMFLSAISNLFGVGGAGVISRALGRQDPQRARNASAFCFWGCLLTTLLYSLFSYLFLDLFTDLLGGSDTAVHQFACQYLTYTVVLGGWAASMSTFLSHLIRSEGRSLQASIGIALGGVLNIALDPLFMFVLLPAGNEIQGAAIATALSNLIALIYFCIVLLQNRKKSVLSFRITRAAFQSRIPRDVLGTGLPACLMTLFENISYAILDNLMAAYGISVQAGLGVAKKVNMLSHCIVRGMSQGVLPLIGYNYAANNQKRMRACVRMSTCMSVILATICTVCCLLFSEDLIRIFIQPESVSLHYGAKFLMILCLGAPFSASAYAFISFFQAVGKGLRSFLLAILRKGILDIPLMFLLRRIIPIFGIVWATPIADAACCCVSLIMFSVFLHKQVKKEELSV